MAKLFDATGLSYRTAGWAAIASGTLGILAYAALMTAVMTRTTMALTGQVFFLFRTHDVIVILQFLLMIPALVALHKLSHKQLQGMSRATLATGIVALSLTALFLIFIFPWIMSDEYYMIPQAMFGVWLIVVNWQLSGVLSRGIRWFGMVVGVGLLLVGIFEVGYAIFVNPIGLRIPAVPIEELEIPVETTANIILHNILVIGSFMGVLTLPIWTIILGRKLLRVKVVQPLT
ncbi:MAG: hypothetical protein EPN92_05160 [Chitinophagaceae bacterium]|nr:MAG: hypothetical protein EPN92_05160 [Chitinophagaceae bacterium]